jgi:hypothetical protein
MRKIRLSTIGGLLFAAAVTFVLWCSGASASATLSVPESIIAMPGGTLTVSVSLQDSTGVFGFAFELSYDASVFECTDVQTGGLTVGWNLEHNAQPGRVTVGGFSATSLTGSGSIAVLQFQVSPDAPNGHQYPLQFVMAELNDGAIPSSAHDGQFTIEDKAQLSISPGLTAPPGEEVDIPVYLDNASGVSVYGYYLELAYDAGRLDFVRATPGDMAAGWGAPEIAVHPGYISVGGLGVNALPAAGTLGVFRFQVKPGVPQWTRIPLIFQYADLNDDPALVMTEDGVLQVVSLDLLPAGGTVTWIVLFLALACLGACLGLRAWPGRSVSSNRFPRRE